MKKPRPIRKRYFIADVHKDSVGKHIDIDAQTLSIKQAKRLHKWLGEAIRFIESK